MWTISVQVRMRNFQAVKERKRLQMSKRLQRIWIMKREKRRRLQRVKRLEGF